MKTEECPDSKPRVRTIPEIFEDAKSNPKNCRSVIDKLENLTDKGKLKLLKDSPTWIVRILNNGTVSKEEILYYGLAKQAKSNQKIKKGFWIIEGVTVNQNGGYCIANSGAVVNQIGGICYARSGAIVNQSNDYCYAFSGAVVNQSRGDCIANSGAVVNQNGGNCYAYYGSLTNQSGGSCYAYHGAVVNQSGGYCNADSGAIVNQIGEGGIIDWI
jgi:hypothetical protein